MLTIMILLFALAATTALVHRGGADLGASPDLGRDRDSARIAAELRAITGMREHG
ncbi:hypothetical protein [Nocardia sp. alder85J]|uniref:hypothetical protein n=1 Tax=Nocardia sp. alder85J TaxID=2862949 RepID=UPI001CD3FABD|nr:hypothetical protein [Nocardia sp. alder85J]MCX4098688.1 hypothetical protein [Nocardia sp. alder85J]